MPMAGSAFLALWNDIAPSREAEYDQWHTLEHVPERVSVRGFFGARRYVNRDHEHHRYFTLYDVEAVWVFASAEYKDLLTNPTPWSASMRPDFSNFLRATCATSLSQGTGIGASIATLCIAAGIADEAVAAALSRVMELPHVNAVHCGRRSEPALTVPFNAPPPQSASVREFDHVALIEAISRDAATSALTRLREELRIKAAPGECTSSVFDLQFVFPGNQLGERQRHRRPAWDQLPP